MITRYTRPEMGAIFSQNSRFEYLMRVEVAVAQAQEELGIIPKDAAKAIAAKAAFEVSRIEEIEKTTKHDVIAFVSSMAEKVGEAGRYIHYGMTSSDVLDTALNVQVQEARKVLMKSFSRLEKALRDKAKE